MSDHDPVTDPKFWTDRVLACGGDLQRALFKGSPDDFSAKHFLQQKQILSAGIKSTDSIIDVGCGYGRLLHMLPESWSGRYLGIDTCPEFIAMARILFPGKVFDIVSGDNIPVLNKEFDIAISVWTKQMVIRELGEEAWEPFEREMDRVAKRVIHID